MVAFTTWVEIMYQNIVFLFYHSFMQAISI